MPRRHHHSNLLLCHTHKTVGYMHHLSTDIRLADTMLVELKWSVLDKESQLLLKCIISLCIYTYMKVYTIYTVVPLC